MRSTLTTLAVGFILGATLGFAGLWTQVIQPAKEQIQELEAEHGILQSALDTATEALTKAATELRAEAEKSTGQSIQAGTGPVPLPALPGQPQPAQPQPAQPGPTPLVVPTRTREVANDLDSLAKRLRETRNRKR
ncbi:MAG: hypothetical protein HS108_09355 [Planctomycetes bacterium]|jgi:hypothetical protein|nr:hypothetical protein [Planctomycetota bacterium]MCL4731712.1 hypothetical protein [Planctomycetota bacterium]